jgi:hypothetical protein
MVNDKFNYYFKYIAIMSGHALFQVPYYYYPETHALQQLGSLFLYKLVTTRLYPLYTTILTAHPRGKYEGSPIQVSNHSKYSFLTDRVLQIRNALITDEGLGSCSKRSSAIYPGFGYEQEKLRFASQFTVSQEIGVNYSRRAHYAYSMHSYRVL